MNNKLPDDDKPAWPVGSMLLIGTFGAQHSPAAVRYQRQCWMALSLLAAGMLAAAVGSRLIGNHATRWISGALMAGTFSFIAWALWRYVNALDELSRRLQMEAMAITYLIGLAVFMSLQGLQIATSWTAIPLLYIALDVVRGIVLVVLSRRYR